VQPSEPATELLTAAAAVTADWMRRITLRAASDCGFDAEVLGPALDVMVESESARLIEAMRELLTTDVDRQRTNPLSLFRDAIAAPTALLRSIGVAPPRADQFVAERFPDDAYGLGPAAWSDIDQRLHEPGLIWGAWKAMTILRRRSDEGLR